MIIKKLVTLNVLYWMPDYENILQQFTWQTKDIVPEYPRVHKFLNHWHKRRAQKCCEWKTELR